MGEGTGPVIFLSPPPAVLRYTIDGMCVPAQMGVLLPGGGIARKGTARVRSYKQRVAILTMLRVRQVRWTCGPEERISVTLRAFVEDARVIDVDNIAKAALDAIKRVAFPDDRQVVDLHVFKRIDRERPRVEVTIERIKDQ